MTTRTLGLLLGLVGLLTLVLVACTQTGQPVPDEEISLRKAALTEQASEPAPTYPDTWPGDAKLVPRAFYGAPPVVPHSVVDLYVTAEVNDCLDCHELGDEDTPAMPPSHRIKATVAVLQRDAVSSGQLTRVQGFHQVTRVAGNRYDCNLCHVPQSTAAPLVKNTFRPVQPDDSGLRDALQGLPQEGKF